MTTKILRSDTEEARELLAAGWQVQARSWGARFQIRSETDLAHLRSVAAATSFDIRELTGDDLDEVRALDDEVAPDFPSQLSSHHTPLPEPWPTTWRAWGGFDDEVLVCVTILEPAGDRWDVERTMTRAAYRNQGLAKAVKARSMADLAGEGADTFGTGGAEVNEASLAMNKALGFVLEPEWLTLAEPGITD